MAICKGLFDAKDAEQIQIGSKCSFVIKEPFFRKTCEATVLEIGTYGKYFIRIDNFTGDYYADLAAKPGSTRWIDDDVLELKWLWHPVTPQETEDQKLAMRLLKEYKESERQLGL